MGKLKLLQKGDVIELKHGMRVYASVPECLVYENKKQSQKFDVTDVTLTEKFNWLIGKYVVEHTSLEGGSDWYSNEYRDNGYKVYCRNLEHEDVNVSFYQTGSFTAMNEYVKPIKNIYEKNSIRKFFIDYDLDELFQEEESLTLQKIRYGFETELQPFDWRRYVHKFFVKNWSELTKEEQKIIFIMANNYALRLKNG